VLPVPEVGSLQAERQKQIQCLERGANLTGSEPQDTILVMSDRPQLKSAYELALERMERAGLERPSDSALSDQERAQIADVRRQAEAKLAELEILYRDRIRGIGDPIRLAEEEDHYQRDRRHVESERDQKLARLGRES
jgi:hypothetical protein